MTVMQTNPEHTQPSVQLEFEQEKGTCNAKRRVDGSLPRKKSFDDSLR